MVKGFVVDVQRLKNLQEHDRVAELRMSSALAVMGLPNRSKMQAASSGVLMGSPVSRSISSAVRVPAPLGRPVALLPFVTLAGIDAGSMSDRKMRRQLSTLPSSTLNAVTRSFAA